MTEYLNKLFDGMVVDNGKTINVLINNWIIDYQEVLSTLLKEGSSSRLYMFAKYVKTVTKEDKIKIAKELIRRNAVAEIFNMAKNVSEAPIEMLEKAIIDSKIGHFICVFAKEVKGANIDLLEKAIIDLGSAEYMYRFALNVPEADIDSLTGAIIQTQNAKYICLFAVTVPGANLPFLEDALINIGDLTEYQKFLAYKKKVQDETYAKLCKSLKSGDTGDLAQNRDDYAYLFEEPTPEAKALIRKINDRGY